MTTKQVAPLQYNVEVVTENGWPTPYLIEQWSRLRVDLSNASTPPQIAVNTAAIAAINNTGLSSTAPISATGTIGADNLSVSLATSPVAPGSYTDASITVDAFGRVTAASNGSATSAIATINATGISGTAPVTATGTIGADNLTVALANSPVTPGSYTDASITVDAFGRVTAASSGSATSAISTINATGISGTAPVTATGTIGADNLTVSLANSPVTPGSYTSADITVDAFGRVTAAANGSSGPGGGTNGYDMVYAIDTRTSYTPKFLDLDPAAASLGSYTAVQCTSGSVGFLDDSSARSGNVYDFTTRAGAMLFQGDSQVTQPFGIRYDQTLDDGDTVVVKLVHVTGASVGNNFYRSGISLNDSDTSPISASNLIYLYADGSDNDNVKLWNGSSIIAEVTGGVVPGGPLYLRVTRSGNVYYFFSSTTGEGWAACGEFSSTALDNFWVWFDYDPALSGEIAPIAQLQWIRHVASTALDAF